MAIIFKDKAGKVHVASVAEGVDEVAEAKKITPNGLPFLILENRALPNDAPVEFWQVNDSDLTSGVGDQ